jgi:hypothetical protein
MFGQTYENNKKMLKLVINSHPRTGISRLLEYLRISYNRTEKVEYGEYSNRDNFILWTHIPVMLLSNFNDIKQITIIRNPDDVIPSICDKLDSGIGLDVHDGQRTYHNSNLDLFEDKNKYLQHTVNASCLEYLSYLDNTINNFNNLLVFSFEDIIYNIDLIVNKVSSFFNEPNILLSKTFIIETDPIIHNKWRQEEGDLFFRSNRGPREIKPESYYEFKTIFLSHPLRNELVSKYQTLINQIKSL